MESINRGALFIDSSDQTKIFTDNAGNDHTVVYREIGTLAKIGILSDPEIVSEDGRVQNAGLAIYRLMEEAHIVIDGRPINRAMADQFSDSFVEWMFSERVIGSLEDLKGLGA